MVHQPRGRPYRRWTLATSASSTSTRTAPRWSFLPRRPTPPSRWWVPVLVALARRPHGHATQREESQVQHMLAQHTRHRHTDTQIHRYTDTQPEPQPHSHAATHPDLAVAIDCRHISFRWAAVSRSTACWRYAWVSVSPCTAAAAAACEVAGRPSTTRGTITPPRRPHVCPIVGHDVLCTPCGTWRHGVSGAAHMGPHGATHASNRRE